MFAPYHHSLGVRTKENSVGEHQYRADRRVRTPPLMRSKFYFTSILQPILANDSETYQE